MKKIKCPALLPGSKIGVVAPASPVKSEEILKSALARLHDRGYFVKSGAAVCAGDGYLSGSDFLRQVDLEGMVLDQSINAIWCLRGGYGCIRLLPRLCLRFFAESPKILIGFSDITALELGLWSCIKMVSFHGPVLTTLESPFSAQQAFEMLSGQIEGALIWPENKLKITVIKPGKTVGTLIGGNLTTLCSLIGTKYLPNLEGAILFLEEIGEATYRIDRLLTQLILSGAIDSIAAILIGKCLPIDGQDESEIIALFTEKLHSLRCPSAYGYPIGHIYEQWTLPQGVLAEVDTETGEVVLLENPVIKV